jgi:hypothetical protein
MVLEQESYKNLHEEILSISNDVAYTKWACKKIKPENYEEQLKFIYDSIYHHARLGCRVAVVLVQAINFSQSLYRKKISDHFISQGFEFSAGYTYITIKW